MAARDAEADMIPAVPGRRLDLFLLAGQSNMSGRGDLEDLAGASPRRAERIWRWRSMGGWEPARDPLQEPDDPIFAANADQNGGVGPGLWFADNLAERKADMHLGLVLCARGGTPIDRWRRDESPQSIYGATLHRVREASAGGKLRAVLFSHGESAAHSREGAEAWRDQFLRFIDNLRRDLSNPRLPVFFTQLGAVSAFRRTQREHGYAAWDYLKELQAGLSLEDVFMIRTDDLELKPDGIHLSTRSQIELGSRFADLVHQTVYRRSAVEPAQPNPGAGR